MRKGYKPSYLFKKQEEGTQTYKPSSKDKRKGHKPSKNNEKGIQNLVKRQKKEIQNLVKRKRKVYKPSSKDQKIRDQKIRGRFTNSRQRKKQKR